MIYVKLNYFLFAISIAISIAKKFAWFTECGKMGKCAWYIIRNIVHNTTNNIIHGLLSRYIPGIFYSQIYY